MQIGKKTWWIASAVCFALFLGLTASVLWLDVSPIGPLESEVGLSTLNGAVKDVVEQREGWYRLTEWLGYLAIASVAGFGLLGIWQLCLRGRFSAVDRDLYCVAGAYALVAVCYVFFEIAVVNYRPILMSGELEASFPSSHTMMVSVLMGVAAHQLYQRVPSTVAKWIFVILCSLISVVTTAGRLLSGVHWMTDILGGALLGATILFAYLGSVRAVLTNKTAEKQ